MTVFKESGLKKIKALEDQLSELQVSCQEKIDRPGNSLSKQNGLNLAKEMLMRSRHLINAGREQDPKTLAETYVDMGLYDDVRFIDFKNLTYVPPIFNSTTRKFALSFKAALANINAYEDLELKKMLGLKGYLAFLNVLSGGKIEEKIAEKIDEWQKQIATEMENNISFYDQCCQLKDQTVPLLEVTTATEKYFLDAAKKAETLNDFRKIKSEYDIYVLTMLQSNSVSPEFCLSCLKLQSNLNRAFRDNKNFQKLERLPTTTTFNHIKKMLGQPMLDAMKACLSEKERRLNADSKALVEKFLKEFTDVKKTGKFFKIINEYVNKKGKPEKRQLIANVLAAFNAAKSSGSYANIISDTLPVVYQGLDSFDELTKREKSQQSDCHDYLLAWSKYLLIMLEQVDCRPSLSTQAALLKSMAQSMDQEIPAASDLDEKRMGADAQLQGSSEDEAGPPPPTMRHDSNHKRPGSRMS